jgi:hypothetical protein
MTPERSVQVGSPAALLSVVPYLIGFHPADSIVVVAMRGRKVRFAARHDLPARDASAPEAQAEAGYLAAVVARQDVDRTRIIGYGEPVRVTPAVLRLAEALRRIDVRVDDVLRVTDGRYWSYECDEPRCCPPEGTPFRPDESVVAAEAIYRGAVALPDRAAMVAQTAAVTGAEREAMTAATARAQARVADLVGPETAGNGFARSVRRAGRRAVRDAERRYRSGRRLTEDETAWLGVLLVDPQVRDYAGERIGPEPWRVPLWTDVLRRMEPAYVPAPACLLGLAAWQTGDGALAWAAVNRAVEVEEEYPMAVALQHILSCGVPPPAVADWPLVDRLELGGGPGPDPARPRPPGLAPPRPVGRRDPRPQARRRSRRRAV